MRKKLDVLQQSYDRDLMVQHVALHLWLHSVKLRWKGCR